MKNYLQIITLVFCLFTTTNVLKAQWTDTQCPNDGKITSLAVSGTTIFAGAPDEGIFRSFNSGTNWVKTNVGMSNSTVNTLAIIDENLFAGTSGGGVLVSTNNGKTWKEVNYGLSNLNIESFASIENKLYVGTSGGGLYVSYDNGENWIDAGLANEPVQAIAVFGTDLFAGGDLGLYHSDNNGYTWNPVNTGLSNTGITSMVVSQSNLFVGTYGGGIFRSTNNGLFWKEVNIGLSNLNVLSLSADGSNLYAGTSGGGVFVSTDNGSTWTEMNVGLTDTKIFSIAVAGTNLYVGTEQGVWSRPTSETTALYEIQGSTGLLNEIGLDQNYPNPVFHETTIGFGVPRSEFVRLKIFNQLGKEVATLVSEELSEGTYEVIWGAENLPGGVYVYQLQVGAVCKSKELLLIR